jgi:hypothetical protein
LERVLQRDVVHPEHGQVADVLVLRTFVVNQTTIGGDQVGAGAEAMPPQLPLQMAILVVALVLISSSIPSCKSTSPRES